MNTVLLASLQQPWLYAVTVKLYVSPQSSPGNWHVEPVELQLFTSPPDVLMALALYISTSDRSSQDRAAVREPHCRLTATRRGGQGPMERCRRIRVNLKSWSNKTGMNSYCKRSVTHVWWGWCVSALWGCTARWWRWGWGCRFPHNSNPSRYSCAAESHTESEGLRWRWLSKKSLLCHTWRSRTQRQHHQSYNWPLPPPLLADKELRKENINAWAPKIHI